MCALECTFLQLTDPTLPPLRGAYPRLCEEKELEKVDKKNTVRG